MAKYNTIEIVQESSTSGVFNLCLNNPARGNALSRDFFAEFPEALRYLDDKASVIVLSGNGKHFCSGIDVDTLISTLGQMNSGAIDKGHVGAMLRREIKFMQSAISAIEQCRKPVIAAIHGACIGGGVDIVTSCDIRYCTEDAFFSVKEVDIGFAADLGTLQRLPGVIGYGKAMELALTGRRFSGLEAKELGLISKTFPSNSELNIGVKAIAEGWISFLSKNSPHWTSCSRGVKQAGGPAAWPITTH